ncbi:MAG: hypothetical protein MUC49_22650 [Raineya sp.]|jgi:superfamily II DNA or RNA helicase|nr:hypothetical protein [Raineya sp.]
MHIESENYKNYYIKPILDEVIGFKPVLGGTGLGKTMGVIEAIKEVPLSRKYVYITNRHFLLTQMEKDLEEYGIKHLYLKRDLDVFEDLLKCNSLQDIIISLHQIDFFSYEDIFKGKSGQEISKYFKTTFDTLKLVSQSSN